MQRGKRGEGSCGEWSLQDVGLVSASDPMAQPAGWTLNMRGAQKVSGG